MGIGQLILLTLELADTVHAACMEFNSQMFSFDSTALEQPFADHVQSLCHRPMFRHISYVSIEAHVPSGATHIRNTNDSMTPTEYM